MTDQEEIRGGPGDDRAAHFVGGGAQQRAPDPDREADQQEDEDAGDGEAR